MARGRTTKSDLEEIVEMRIQPHFNNELRLSGRAGRNGRVYTLLETLPEGGASDLVRAEGAGTMERVLRGLEVGLKH